jgi:hypothetical protein
MSSVIGINLLFVAPRKKVEAKNPTKWSKQSHEKGTIDIRQA